MSKIGLSLSMIGGMLFFLLTYFFFRNYYSLWKLDIESALFFYFFLFANGGAIIGGLLGFIRKNWQITKLCRIESEKVGQALCFLAGLSYPLFLIIFYVGVQSLTFSVFFEDFIAIFFISIPELILFIGTITLVLELVFKSRRNNVITDKI